LTQEPIDQDEIHRRLFSLKNEDKEIAIYQLASCFFIFPDKVAAWSDLLYLTKDEDSTIGHRAAQALGLHLDERGTLYGME